MLERFRRFQLSQAIALPAWAQATAMKRIGNNLTENITGNRREDFELVKTILALMQVKNSMVNIAVNVKPT